MEQFRRKPPDLGIAVRRLCPFCGLGIFARALRVSERIVKILARPTEPFFIRAWPGILAGIHAIHPAGRAHRGHLSHCQTRKWAFPSGEYMSLRTCHLLPPLPRCTLRVFMVANSRRQTRPPSSMQRHKIFPSFPPRTTCPKFRPRLNVTYDGTACLFARRVLMRAIFVKWNLRDLKNVGVALA